MTPFVLELLCDPVDQSELKLVNGKYDEHGNITEGDLVSQNGRTYKIIRGIPRFVEAKSSAVESFGDEWNYFNFIDFKENWLRHTVKNTFGGPDAFKDKIVVDCGAGSGAQSRWFLDYGAKHVISLELSHAVDGIFDENFESSTASRHDIIQCSIDNPPLKKESIEGIVYCHNVIQHTESVEKTATRLYGLVGKNGEFVFNCYPLNDEGMIRWIRFHLIYGNLRKFLSKRSFKFILFYAKLVAILRCIPFIGEIVEKLMISITGDVPKKGSRLSWVQLKEIYRHASLNTFDYYGSHTYQHHKSDAEIKKLVSELQPDESKIHNMEKYFAKPAPIGCALRVYR